MDGSKSTGRKVGYVAVFRRRTLPKEASIHIAEITAMKERTRGGEYIQTR